MVLTRDVILAEIKKGNIAISPFGESALGPASYDLTLGDTLRIFVERPKPYIVHDEVDFTQITKLIRLTDAGYTLKPSEAILGITREKITLAPRIAGWLEGRSRFARIGLMVHISSPFMQPGISNRQVLEIANLSPTPLTILPGIKICQFVFERCEGEATYRGKFEKQDSP